MDIKMTLRDASPCRCPGTVADIQKYLCVTHLQLNTVRCEGKKEGRKKEREKPLSVSV